MFAAVKTVWKAFWGRWNQREGYVFVLPSFLHLLVFFLIPLGFSLWLSFHDWRGLTTRNIPFVGLENYRFMFGDTRWWNAVWNTLVYTFVSVPLGMALSLLVALVMNQKIPGIYAFRAMFFMPVITSWVAVSVVWLWILDGRLGLLNYAFSLVGIDGPDWLSDPRTALFALILITVWKGLGFQMVIWLAGLQAIPKELYEAAIVDGANRVQQFRFVTLPMLAPTTFFLLITGIIGSFQVFTPVFVLTKGGPLGTTDVAVYRIYERAFVNFDFGYASALAWVLFVFIFVATLIQLYYMRRNLGGMYGR
ncbi:MAG TPA: sugar ABC transporter permease [Candidatus Macondimonas sp.]|nr:sugar ABC transporter permease [Candidatus Macondimonas sp.]